MARRIDFNGRRSRDTCLLGSVLLVAILIGSTILPIRGPAPSEASVAAPAAAESLAELEDAAPRPVSYPVADRPVPGSGMLGPATESSIPILLSLDYSDQSSLTALLSALSNPASPEYHQYLSATEFDDEYAPSAVAYANALEYVESFAVTDVSTFPDRSAIAFDVSAATADAMFHTTLDQFQWHGTSYMAPIAPPELPSSIAGTVLQVEGLGSYPDQFFRTALATAPALHPIAHILAPPTLAPGYLAPPEFSGVQYEYGSDFQVAYDEQSLFGEYGYPTNSTVATILWGGQYDYGGTITPYGPLSPGEKLPAFDPADVDSFFNETLPAGEPDPVVTGVPVDGAVAPGPLAPWDTSGAVVENTLDLEMVGSTAPGAHIYNVYGPAPTAAGVDAAFAFILSPNASFSALSHVSVISNSWGENDTNDSSWYSDLEQAQARGISVLASTGDSDDSTASSKYAGTTVEFPSSMAYNTFGVTAVGGTTVSLNTTSLQIDRQIAWSDLDTTPAVGPVGSTGGVSALFPEPSWQVSSPQANGVITSAGLGRGVPDLAGLANNTLLTLSINQTQYKATDATFGGSFLAVSGTSVATPLTAGLVATVDHTLVAADNPLLGFLDPELYAWANEEYAPVADVSSTIGEINSTYNSFLPALPLDDVTVGGNALYDALPGYDLVTGWGSLDAYNYTMYVLRVASSGIFGRLAGVQDRWNLSGLQVSSTGPDSEFNASTQQNFFLANSLGAPIYWVQNVVYINGTPGDWDMNFTGWVVWPFWGLYPSASIYEYNFPAVGLAETTPLEFNFTTQLINTSSPAVTPTMVFSFGVAGTSSLYLPVPGAAYILGGLNDSYSWQGTTYTNGPYPGDRFPEGFLAPQFALVGGPSGGVGSFGALTAGTVQAAVEPFGTSTFVAAGTSVLPISASQTGEQSANVGFTQTSGNSWSFSYHPAGSDQGIIQFEDGADVPGFYAVQFNESGVPLAATWWVNVTGQGSFTATGSVDHMDVYLVNASYNWSARSNVPKGIFVPGLGSVLVNGAPEFIDLSFSVPNNTATFSETGLAAGSTWTVTIYPGPVLNGNSSSFTVRLDDGNYTYYVAGPDTTWEPTPEKGVLSVGTTPTSIAIAFVRVTFVVKFIPAFDGTGAVAWSVAIAGAFVNGTSANGTLRLTNGTYPYTITVPSGYSVTPSRGNFTLGGSLPELRFTVSPVRSGSSGLSSWELLAIGALVVGLIVVVIAIAATRRSGRAPPPPYTYEPPSWLPPPPPPTP